MKKFINVLLSQTRHIQDAIASDKDTMWALMAFAAVVLVIPFDTTQLFLLTLGAALAAIGQRQQSYAKQKETRVPRITRHSGLRTKKTRTVPKLQGQKLRPATSLTSFQAADFEGQIEELVSQLNPNSASTLSTLSVLSKTTTNVLRKSFPDVEVLAVASGDISRNSAFAVAVPEVHLVVVGGPVLARMLEEKARNSDVARANKAAVQSIVSLLIQNAGFKFRRSSFRTLEPKVTLLAPEEGGDGVVVDVVVNGFRALQEKAVIDSCGVMDARAQGLVFLVRRWAKNRGLCHTSQGHLSAYAWSLLTISYLQQGLILPAVVAAVGHQMPQVTWGHANAAKDERHISDLLSGFMKWCAALDWTSGVVTVTARPNDILEDEGRLHIADPFSFSKNMASGLSLEATDRSKQEIARAMKILAQKPSLVSLLEPWIPRAESVPTTTERT